jgi:pSer/pThr/pTyr-binding forkhead associated (FHA) protein
LHAKTGPSDKQHVTNDAVLGIEVLKNRKCEQVLDISQSQSRVMIGRADDSELRLGGNFVSRHHALIILSDDEIIIEDLKSFNGTIVNGSKITRRKIGPGDKINIGDYELRIRTS